MAIGLVEATWKTVVRSGWRAQLCRSTCSNHAQSSSRTSRSTSYYSVRTRVGSASKSNTKAQTLAGIAVGCDEKANTIRFYNPLAKSYYNPPVVKLDEGCLPASHFHNRITFDGGLVCGLQSNKTDPVPKPFPPGNYSSQCVS
eukprot:scaffold34974_cov72-Cyclotella_meneghiniana.AAC.2